MLLLLLGGALLLLAIAAFNVTVRITVASA